MPGIQVEIVCRDFEEPGCLQTPDEQYTMSFEDIGEGCIYWCSHCGPKAQAINEAFTLALETRGPEFVKKAEAAIIKAAYEQREKES